MGVAMKEMTDDEVFGQPKEMSDDDVFGAQPTAASAPKAEAEQASTGFLSRVAAGFKNIPHDISDIFTGGIQAFTQAPGQIIGATGPSDTSLSTKIVERLRQAGASKEEAELEAERLMRRMGRGEGLANIAGGPISAITSPLLGAFRSLFARPVEETTGLPIETTEMLGMAGLAAAGLRGVPHTVARVRIGENGDVTAHPIGELPRNEDFKTAADVLGGGKNTEPNLRRMWDEDGIHPAEAVHDAQRDALLRQMLTEIDPWPMDRSGIGPVQGSHVPMGTPRTELAKTGDPLVDATLDHPVLRQVINNPVVDDTRTIPNSWGDSTPVDNPLLYRDRDFPKQMTVDGVTYDTFEPAAVRENVEGLWVRVLMDGGMDRDAAFKVAALAGDKSENAWYAAHGIDPAHAEAEYTKILDEIASRKADDVPPDLFKGTYPDGDPRKAEPGPIDKPTPEETARGRKIMEDFFSRERIIAATYTIDGKVYTGSNHIAAMDAAVADLKLGGYDELIDRLGGLAEHRAADGFLTDKGRVVDRQEAASIVDAAGQGQASRPGSLKMEDIGPQPASLGAAATTAQPPTLTQQPPPPPGRLMTAVRDATDKLFDIGKDIQKLLSPMVLGSRDSMAIAKDFANSKRRNAWEWQRIDTHIVDNFSPEQRKRMFNAMDEESVALQLGESREHQGLITLEPEERALVEYLDAHQQVAWKEARDVGIVEGEGIPMHATRMVMNIAEAKNKDKALALDAIGRNLTVRTPFLRHRKYMTVEETEAAAKAAFGEQAVVARDIRAVALSTDKLQDAITGRRLVNAIKEYGKLTGDEVVSEGGKPVGSEYGWFTIDHPALKTWKPDLKTDPVTGKTSAKSDDAGNVIFKQVPIYIRNDFEGPLRAVLTGTDSQLYGFMMSLKGKTMSLIMNSPLIHNAVEFGRAFPTMPLRIFTTYFRGNRAKNDPVLMREAIDSGLVPIGKRFFNQDINAVMEEPSLTPGRSWTAQALGETIGRLPQKGMTTEEVMAQVKSDVDKAGDFWHNTLLWDRIADLQMGLYSDFLGDMIAKGVDRRTATTVAAHLANRYAGALPQEAMSSGARKLANFMFFSRTFTLGNLGVLKDTITGLPKDVVAQLERDVGETDPNAVGYAKSLARRKAFSAVMTDIALLYVANSVMQSALNVLWTRDNTLDEEMKGYVRRWQAMVNDMSAHPLSAITPLTLAGAGLGAAVGGIGGAAIGALGGTALSAARKLSATAENEPGKQDRLKVGYGADGTAIYARNVFGKMGEEYIGYMTEPLEMLRRKEGTMIRPVLQVLANDKGFGRKVYDPYAETTADKAHSMLQIVEHFAKAQIPEGQVNALGSLIKGEGDQKIAALQAFGPIAGVTFSKGAPGGPAIGELYHARSEHDYKVQMALPDIRKQIQRGDVMGARERMTDLGIPKGLQNYYVKTTLDPSRRLSSRALRDFNLYATPEERARMERFRAAPQ